ncbi:type 1 glutamine amidotransferase [Pedobacter sp. UYEF25]
MSLTLNYAAKVLCLVALTFLFQSCSTTRTNTQKNVRVLVFSKTTAFRHASIPKGKLALMKLGTENNFAVDTTENADVFTAENLKKYAAVIFLSTTGDVLNDAQQKAFEDYFKNGHGFVGIHAATDTEYGWPWYGEMIGARFLSHPQIQEARFVIKDKNHPSTKFFTDSVWMHKDELYNFKEIKPGIHVLITIDEKSYEGGKNGAIHPFSWYQNFEGGRMFYTAMGHTDETYSDPVFLKNLLGGIDYALGKRK